MSNPFHEVVNGRPVSPCPNRFRHAAGPQFGPVASPCYGSHRDRISQGFTPRNITPL